MTDQKQALELAQEATAKLLYYKDWDDATDYRITGREDRIRDRTLQAFLDFALTMNASVKGDVVALRNAALDALAGWRYIRQHHGDLYGVAWDRVEDALSAALQPEAKEPEWRPISEATEDGGLKWVGRWANHEGERHWCVWDAVFDGGSLGCDGIEGKPPTHFASFPAAPKEPGA